VTDPYKRDMCVVVWMVGIVTLVVQTTFLAGTLLLTTVTVGETLEPFFDSTGGLKFYLLVGTIVACRATMLAYPVALAKWRIAAAQHHDPVRRRFRLAREASFLAWAGYMIVILSGLFWPISLLLGRRLRRTRRSRLAEADERDVAELSKAMREDAG